MVNKLQNVHLIEVSGYQPDYIYESLTKELFSIILPGDTVVLKPNWVLEGHQNRKEEWEQVITNPAITTAVLHIVVDCLENRGHIIITDGPELNADFDKILSLHPLDEWRRLTDQHNISLQIIDLREELYIQDKNVTVRKLRLPGDPKGKVVANLFEQASEFFGHKKSEKGYFGAGSDIRETNCAHDGHTNLYSVSRSVIEADVFINLPKLKTHKKGGITCSLKNLVGINTYRNYLPHNSIGTPAEGGDQFPTSEAKSRVESTLMPIIHQNILKYPFLAKFFSPVMGLGKKVFGNNQKTIRGGSWFGNDTLWRMVLDINKVLFYANTNGTLRGGVIPNMKKYISIVDSIVAGEGNGPKAPDAINVGYIMAGLNPVAVDAVCACLMGFDPDKIPSITNAFSIENFPLVKFSLVEIKILFQEKEYSLSNFPSSLVKKFKPHQGWIGHIERLYN